MKKYTVNGKVALNFIQNNYFGTLHNLVGPVGSGKTFNKIMKVSSFNNEVNCYWLTDVNNFGNIKKQLLDLGFINENNTFTLNEEFYLNDLLIKPNVKINLIDYNDYLNKLTETHNVVVIDFIENLKYDVISKIINMNLLDNLIISDSFVKINYNSVVYEYQPDGDTIYAENTENLPINYYDTLKTHLTPESYRKLVQVNFTRY